MIDIGFIYEITPELSLSFMSQSRWPLADPLKVESVHWLNLICSVWIGAPEAEWDILGYGTAGCTQYPFKSVSPAVRSPAHRILQATNLLTW